MSQQVVLGTLAAAVADAGTFAVSYPTGMSRGEFSTGTNAKLVISGQVLSQPADIGLSYGASSVTITNRTGATWRAGATFRFQFDMAGRINPVYYIGIEQYTPLDVVKVNLGSPIPADADGIFASASLTLAAGAISGTALTGAITVAGVCDLGLTGRNVVAAWTGTAILTVTGTDLYGNVMVEKSASGTSLTGVKAFKIITSIAVSANVTSLTVGTGDVLGIPVRLPSAGHILKEHEDGAAATAGTVVGGLALDTESTATSADVRGTYDPNSACDGSKGFALYCALPDPGFLGQPQYAG